MCISLRCKYTYFSGAQTDMETTNFHEEEEEVEDEDVKKHNPTTKELKRVYTVLTCKNKARASQRERVSLGTWHLPRSKLKFIKSFINYRKRAI